MKSNILKSIVIGLIVGLIATALGSILWIIGFSDHSISETIDLAIREQLIAPILSAGALLNLVIFFIFLKQNKPYQARGVLLATFLVAIFVLVQKFR